MYDGYFFLFIEDIMEAFMDDFFYIWYDFWALFEWFV